MDELLQVGGQVLIGPDLVTDESQTAEIKIAYWNNFYALNPILKTKYRKVFSFQTVQNFVLVCQKMKD
jgi:hypothetical protein